MGRHIKTNDALKKSGNKRSRKEPKVKKTCSGGIQVGSNVIERGTWRYYIPSTDDKEQYRSIWRARDYCCGVCGITVQ